MRKDKKITTAFRVKNDLHMQGVMELTSRNNPPYRLNRPVEFSPLQVAITQNSRLFIRENSATKRNSNEQPKLALF